MVLSEVIFDVKKICKINKAYQNILILNSIWFLSGRGNLLKYHLNITFMWHQLGFNCETNCQTKWAIRA